MLVFKGYFTVLLTCFLCLYTSGFSNGRCTRNNTINVSSVGNIRNSSNPYNNIIDETSRIRHHDRHHHYDIIEYDDRYINQRVDNRTKNQDRSTKNNRIKLNYNTIGITKIINKSKVSKRGDTRPALLYFGGSVIPNVQVYTIFYGNVTYKEEINRFYSDVVNSTFIDRLSEYNTPNSTIGRGSFIGSHVHTDKTKSLIDDTTDIKLFLFNLIKSGIIQPNKNTLYTIHLAPNVSVTKQKSKSCVDFCAYHSTLDISKIYKIFPYLYYTVVPDLSGLCDGLCGDSLSVFDNTCSIASHELIESITDPGVGLGNIAWYDPFNGEISDICNMQQGLLVINNKTRYTVQKQWSNSQNNCIIDMSSKISPIRAYARISPKTRTKVVTKVATKIVTKVITKTLYGSPITKMVTKTKTSSSHKCTKHT
jgi:hypothetical protein